jgi:iron complex transport system substrate-binding protein
LRKFLLPLLLAGCAPAQPREPARIHPTIVSLNPCADAILAEVAHPVQILAVSQFSRDPSASSMGIEAARRFPAVSGTVEEIVALRPDVVIGDAFVPGPAGAGALDRLGYRIHRYRIETSVEESLAQVREIARLAGHPERGEALAARIEAALIRATPPPGSAPVPAVVWQGGGIVPGEHTLIADLLRRTGFANFAAGQGLRQADMLPLEAMLVDPPRVILSAGDPRAEEDRLLRHPALEALGSTRREAYPSALLWCGGPTLIKAAERLAAVRVRVQ